MRKTFIPQNVFRIFCWSMFWCYPLSFACCIFFYLLIHLSTLIYFNLVAELASDYFLNRKITRFFAGLCETWIKTRSKEFLPYDPVKLMNQPDFADSFVLSSGASEYTAEIKGSPSSSSAITLSSMGDLFSASHRGGLGLNRGGGSGAYKNDSAYSKTNGEHKGLFKRAIS